MIHIMEAQGGDLLEVEAEVTHVVALPEGEARTTIKEEVAVLLGIKGAAVSTKIDWLFYRVDQQSDWGTDPPPL